MGFRSIVLVSAAALGLAACQTAQTTTPDVSARIAAPPAQVRQAVAAVFVQDGFRIARDGDLLMEFVDPPGQHTITPAEIMLTCTRCPGPVWRTEVTVTSTGSATTVTARPVLIVNPETGLQRTIVHPYGEASARAMTARLERVRTTVGAARP